MIRKTINLVQEPKQEKGKETKELSEFIDPATLVNIAAGVTAIANAPKAGETIRKIVDKGKDLLSPSKDDKGKIRES